MHDGGAEEAIHIQVHKDNGLQTSNFIWLSRFFAILTPLTAAAPLINLEQYANKKAEYENKWIKTDLITVTL